jgi:amidophosphoribosyltransferase
MHFLYIYLQPGGMPMPFYLDGPVKDELAFNLRDLLPEECGLFFGFNIDDAAFNCVRSLRAQEPRGERGAGIISLYKGDFYPRHRVGKVSQEFREYDQDRCRKEFPGRIVGGQCRYPTMGGVNKTYNVQPYLRDTRFGKGFLAHNGTFLEAREMRQRLLAQGAVFATTSDTEIFFHVMAMSREQDLEKAVLYALKKIRAAYSLVIVFREKSFLIRDYRGTRPLSMARLGRGYVASSETFAIDQIPEARYWRDVRPGEMLVFERGKAPRSIQYAKPKPGFCEFEPIYFMRPRSKVNGCYVEDFRYALGLAYADVIRVKAKQLGIDCVVPILDSGEYLARGLADGLGVPYLEALARTKNFSENLQDRSFTAASNRERERIVRGKHNLRFDLVRGRYPLVADDSIVRANTSRIIIGWFREAGSKGVAFASGYPPITSPCLKGMDFPKHRELIAFAKNIPQIKQKIGPDWLFFLSEETLAEVTTEKLKIGICGECHRN